MTFASIDKNVAQSGDYCIYCFNKLEPSNLFYTVKCHNISCDFVNFNYGDRSYWRKRHYFNERYVKVVSSNYDGIRTEINDCLLIKEFIEIPKSNKDFDKLIVSLMKLKLYQ